MNKCEQHKANKKLYNIINTVFTWLLNRKSKLLLTNRDHTKCELSKVLMLVFTGFCLNKLKVSCFSVKIIAPLADIDYRKELNYCLRFTKRSHYLVNRYKQFLIHCMFILNKQIYKNCSVAVVFLLKFDWIFEPPPLWNPVHAPKKWKHCKTYLMNAINEIDLVD